MDKEAIRECIEVLRSKEIAPALCRIREQRDQKARSILKGTESDERDRGWYEALEWVLKLPDRMKEDVIESKMVDNQKKM